MAYNPNIDYAAEIEKEFQKGKPNWDTIATLAQAKNEKIKREGIKTKSTQDYLNELMLKYGYPDTNKNPPASAEGNTSIRDYINELLEAQRAMKLAALEAAKIRALTGLDTTYEQRKNMLETSKNTYLSNLQNALNSQLGNLESSLSRQQQALDTAKTNYQASLDNALNKAISNLSSEEAKIAPYYYDARNQVAAASDVGAMNFAQYMAGKGIRGSTAALPEVYRNVALQGQLGAINRQEAANRAEIERARTAIQNEYQTNLAAMTSKYEAEMARLNQDYQNQVARLQNEYESGRGGTLNNYQADLAALEAEYLTHKQGIEQAYQQDILSAQAGISAQGLQAYIDQLNADRLFKLQEAGITGRYGGQPTLQAALAEADLTGMYNGQPTLAAQNQAFNQNIALAGLTGLYQGRPTLAAQQQAFNQALAEAGLTGYYQGQPTLAYRQWQADVDYRNRTFEENVRQFEKQYGLDLKRISLDQAQQAIDKQYKMGQLTQAQAQQALAQARFIEEQKQNNLANFNSYLRQAQQMLQGTYDSSIGSFVGSYTPSQVRAWVVALPLDAQQKADILNALGL